MRIFKSKNRLKAYTHQYKSSNLDGILTITVHVIIYLAITVYSSTNSAK